VCIAVHDAEYLRLKSEWKQRAADAHPDRSGSAFAFRQVQKQRERWEQQEQAWYERHGLTPPDPPRPLVAGPHRHLLLAASHRVFSQADKVRAYKAAHPDATPGDIAAAVGVSKCVAYNALTRQSKSWQHPKYTQQLAALLSDGHPHSVLECQAATSRNALVVIVSRLRDRGFDVVYERRGRFGSYRLVAPPSRLQELQ
jgi:hypothetical protein